MDNMFAAKKDELTNAMDLTQAEAKAILEKVNAANTRLANTKFVGEQAEDLALELNEKMGLFVDTSYTNLDSLTKLIIDSVNVVVTKLGGAPWPYMVLAKVDVAKAAVSRESGGTDYEIDTDDMNTFAGEVDDRFQEIVNCYNNIRNAVVSETPGWMGPEKNSAVGHVNAAIDEILGTPGGEGGVRGVGASLSDRLRAQANLMTSGS